MTRWAALALLGGLACCAQAQPQSEPAPLSTAVVRRTQVYLIAPGGVGVEGGAAAGNVPRPVGCGDRAVPLAVTLPRPGPALEGALTSLLALGGDPDRTGLHNALAPSHLALAGVERRGPEVKVALTGYLELADRCENARLLAELTETALQFPDVSHARFVLDGRPLPEIVGATAR